MKWIEEEWSCSLSLRVHIKKGLIFCELINIDRFLRKIN